MVKGKSIYHCHGKDKGKKMRSYGSHDKALAAHRAIMADSNYSDHVKEVIRKERDS